MMKLLKMGIFLLAMSISMVGCRESEPTDDLSNTEINSNEDGSKVKIKTDETKIKIKTDDYGDVKKK